MKRPYTHTFRRFCENTGFEPPRRLTSAFSLAPGFFLTVSFLLGCCVGALLL